MPPFSDSPVVLRVKLHKILWIAGLFVFLSGGMTLAQVTTGTISGTVYDSMGAVLPGSRVVVLNEETGFSRTIESDAVGRYAALSLRLGSYRVTGAKKGFQTVVRRGILLTEGREAVVDLSLPVGAVTQTVEVIGEAPFVEPTTASMGPSVRDESLRALPWNGGSYDQLALFQPGVVAASPGRFRGSPYLTGAGNRLGVGGMRPGSEPLFAG